MIRGRSEGDGRHGPHENGGTKTGDANGAALASRMGDLLHDRWRISATDAVELDTSPPTLRGGLSDALALAEPSPDRGGARRISVLEVEDGVYIAGAADGGGTKGDRFLPGRTPTVGKSDSVCRAYHKLREALHRYRGSPDLPPR